MKGLIIKPKWANLILQGEKSWEIRGCNTSIRGPIAIIKSGTGMIYGTVELVDSIQVNLSTLTNNINLHCVEDLSVVKYPNPYAWVLKNPVPYDNPIPYTHKQEVVIWANICEQREPPL